MHTWPLIWSLLCSPVIRIRRGRQISSHLAEMIPSLWINFAWITGCYTHRPSVKCRSSTKARGQRSLWTPVFSTCCRAEPMWVIPSRSTLRHRDSSNLEHTHTHAGWDAGLCHFLDLLCVIFWADCSNCSNICWLSHFIYINDYYL